MTTQPTWSAVDNDTASLLDLLAEQNPALPVTADEWEYFITVLEADAIVWGGFIDQNRTRPMLRGRVKPNRIGAYFHRAAREGLIRADGWTESNDTEGGNRGKPCRVYRWLGT